MDPIRCFDGNAKPHERFWKLRNAEELESGSPEIEFYGYISEYSWFEDDITPAIFKNDLNTIGKGGPVTLRINSGGGDVFAASVIRSIIMEYPGKVTARIDGLCASAATFVATAADLVKMQDTAFFMIHDPSTVAWGTVESFKQIIDFLKTIKDGIVEGYQSKTKMEPEKLAQLMTKETWMTAQEAKDFGFVDEVITSPSKAMKSMAILNAITPELMNRYLHIPDEIKNAVIHPEPTPQPAEEPVINQTAAEKLRAEIQILI